ncbi:MAG TPA: protein tyrosine phosphatase family protein [Isosphaeraceae bacterium]|jgi:uncharacterized protein (TIGR01244 family)|nr:protein tyrosine phosphatase family protein [Isosphaeraceae bacterium]
MNQRREITPTITVADQPTEADLEALKAEGFVAVANLRNDGEPEQPLSTTAEGQHVRGLGMDYLHLGVGSAPLNPDGVGAFCEFLDRHAADKVLVHCRKGGRAAALVVLRQALEESWTPEELDPKARAMGVPIEGGLKMLVESYLREHGGTA